MGAEEQISPPVAVQHLAAAIPGARCVEIPAAGYRAPLEQPLAEGRALAESLESLGWGGADARDSLPRTEATAPP